MYRDTNCKLQAHRGVCTEAPENTLAAFRLAAKEGYELIELDPKFTKDNMCVVLHDRTLNRTARIGGRALGEEKLYVQDLLYAQVKNFEVGSHFSPAFASERIPLLSDALHLARELGLECKLDNVVQSFTDEQQEILFRTVEKCGGRVGLTCTDLDLLQKFAARFPTAPLHYDGEVTEAALERILTFSAGHEVTVWMRLAENPRTAWCKTPPADEARVALVKRCGFQLGIWLLTEQQHMTAALALGANVVETDGSIKP
jgi:glycerophosphoryl diester phosphodiesterase